MKNFTNGSILDLSDVSYCRNDGIAAFYTEYRSYISKHLKKKGDKIDFLDDHQLIEDEVLSPTFEEMIVLWCLEKVDPQLPNKIKNKFGLKLQNCSTLKGIQEEIFKSCAEIEEGHKFDELDCDKIVKKEGDQLDDDNVDIDDTIKSEPDEVSENGMLEVELDIEDDWNKQDALLSSANEDTDCDYTCEICRKPFKNEKSMKFHMKKHKSEPCTCEECGKAFKNRDRLGYHVRLVHKLEPCSCSECGATFQTRLNLYNHMRKHKVDPCVCELCSATFKNRSQLCNHKYTAHYLKAMRCKICDLQLTSQSMYTEHLESHKSEGLDDSKFQQNGIGGDLNKIDKVDVEIKDGKINGLSKETNVIVHDLFKQEIKTYPCEMCGKMFNGYSSLKNHQLLQHELKLDCGFCKEEFTSSKLLFIHREKVHNISKSKEKIPCDICGKLIVPCSMRKHMNIHSTDSSKFECDTCKRKFKSEDKMGSHICKHFSCDECDKKFIHNRNLQAHKLEHQGVTMHHCDQCEAMFQKVKLLGTHKRFVHQGVRRYACTLCDKKFAASSGLKDHIRVHHTGEKPFKCEECGTAFKSRSGLHSHMKLHKNEFPLECEVCHKKFRNTGQIKRHRESKLCGVSDQDLFRNNVDS